MAQGYNLSQPDEFGVRALENFGADGRMRLHNFPLCRVKPGWFHQYYVWDTYLTQVVHGRGIQNVEHLTLGHAGLFRDESAVPAHADDMLSRELVLVFHGKHESLDGVVIRFLEFIVDGLENLQTLTQTALYGKSIFIGHGKSPLWRELKDFIAERLNLP